jgi:hypothetical protein
MLPYSIENSSLVMHDDPDRWFDNLSVISCSTLMQDLSLINFALGFYSSSNGAGSHFMVQSFLTSSSAWKNEVAMT